MGRHAARAHIGAGYWVLIGTGKGRPGQTARLEIGVGDGAEVEKNMGFNDIWHVGLGLH